MKAFGILFSVFGLWILCSGMGLSGADPAVSLADTIGEMCRDIPPGTYTLSVTRAEFADPDDEGREMRNRLAFGPETYIFLRNIGRMSDDRLLDYYCLTDSGDATMVRDSAEIIPFETEQTIRGHIIGGSEKPDGFMLRTMIPSVGAIYRNHIDGRRFVLSGFDFVDGVTFSMQALKSNGKDGSLRLVIDEPELPTVSVKKYHYERPRTGLSDAGTDLLAEKSRQADIINSIELPDLVVREKRAKRGYFRGLTPDRQILYGDPILETSNTMDLVVSRFGLRRGVGRVPIQVGDLSNDEDDQVEITGFGSVRNGEFVISEVMLDDHLLSGYEIEEITKFNPADIKQIGFFMPSNYETFGNFAGSKQKGVADPIKGLYGEAARRGMLMIWMKSPTDFSYFRLRRPESLVTYRPLGYTPPREFTPADGASFSSTLYWNPAFSPDGDISHILDSIPLPATSDVTIKIEGLSDNGGLVHKQRTIKL